MTKEEGYLIKLSDYLKKNLKKGYTKESLKWALVSQGHSKIQVDKAMHLADAGLAREAPVLETKPEIKVEIIPDMPKKESIVGGFFKSLFG